MAPRNDDEIQDKIFRLVERYGEDLHGTDTDPGGLVVAVREHSKKISAIEVTLYGTPENPTGIAKDVRTMKRWVGMACAVGSVCAGLLVIMEFFSKMAPAIREMMK